ncbi:MAG TPA: hypothetical protein VGB13_02435 [Candidatus Krumholzibacteria bacterium]|jgi:hypothetical protein
MDERIQKVGSTRREFLRHTLSAASFAGIAIVVSACGSSGGGGGAGPGGCENPTSAMVSTDSGHSHSVRDVCQSDSGGAVSLTLTGGGHTHDASLSAMQVDQVLAGTTVQVTSTSASGHTHTVTFN